MRESIDWVETGEMSGVGRCWLEEPAWLLRRKGRSEELPCGNGGGARGA